MLTASLVAVRRTVTTALLAALIPVMAASVACAAVLSCPVSVRSRGRWRAVRITAFLLVYLVVDVTGVLAAFGARLRHPLTARPDAVVYAELERRLGVLQRAAGRTFGLTLRITPALSAAGPAVPDGVPGDRRPLVVLARHAGPGDSFLVVHSLLADAGLRPHIVLKRLLRLDPCLDTLLSRLPHFFVPARRGAPASVGIAALAARLRAGDALVLFPEGGNFTRRRWERSVAALRRLGRGTAAEAAERMTHVLAPRTTGVLAVLDAAPGADIVFVAHTGLDRIHSVRSAWSALPLRHRVRAHWWRVPSAQVPAGDEARADWLMAQWARIDAWIGHHSTAA